MKLKTSFMFIGSLALSLWAGSAAAQTPAWPEAIADNSFLIEEAYNQEPGVVQHTRSRRAADAERSPFGRAAHSGCSACV
jgi:hypothetical protein